MRRDGTAVLGSANQLSHATSASVGLCGVAQFLHAGERIYLEERPAVPRTVNVSFILESFLLPKYSISLHAEIHIEKELGYVHLLHEI